jgi:N-acetylmuramoyl-L-alanine amidase
MPPSDRPSYQSPSDIIWNVLIRRYLHAATLCAALALLASAGGSAGGQAPAVPAAYTVVSRDARRALPVRVINGQEMFALDDLARLFELTVREEALAGGITVSTRTQTIALTPGQSIASVGRQLISLTAAPLKEGRSWFVPVDFVTRALAPALGTRLDLRRPSRLILLGDVRMPHIAGRVESLGASARLTFDVSPATAHAVTQEGTRLVVRFDADALDTTLSPSPAPELIQAVHPGDGAPVIVVDLGPRFASFRTSDAAADRGAGRVIIDVIAQTTEAAPAPPQAAQPPKEPPPLTDLTPAGMRTIVIDPGHGGDENGARGSGGTLEKNVTMTVARKLKAALEGRLGVRVILTREGDQTVGLDERAAVANNNKADLFVSVHANASLRPAMAGAEVFYLSLEEYGEQAQRVAHAERESLPVLGGGTRDIEVILWEMAQARYIEQSAALARAVEGALRQHVPMSPRAIQQAPFRVLVGANMPAVLVEIGFLSNPPQEQQLNSDGFQGAIVQALVDSIVRFRDSGFGATGVEGAVPARRDGQGTR